MAEAGTTVREMKSLRAQSTRQGAASCSECRIFAQSAFARAAGRQGSVESGFRRQPRAKWWLAGSGAQTVIKEKKRRDYADKTYTLKLVPKSGPKYSREQIRELRDAFKILIGMHGQAEP